MFILIGKQLEIEFRVSLPRQERGRRPGEPVPQNSSPEQRWGFRLTIYPIYASPSFSQDAGVKKKAFGPIFNRLDSEKNLYNWFLFFIMTVYVASAFTQDLSSKDLLQQAIQKGDTNEHLVSWDERKEPKKSDRSKDSIAVSNILQSEVLNWHLLKGGLSCSKSSANADMDSLLKESLSNINAQNYFARQLSSHL